MNTTPTLVKNRVAIGSFWLFHITAIIGISLGYSEWFLSKTPINLLLCILLFSYTFPLHHRKHLFAAISFVILGMAAEMLGVNFGWFFGSYEYGTNLGMKIAGVPLLIGLNWALLTFATASISQWVSKYKAIQIMIGSGLMLLLDIAMEYNAPRFDFWEFEHGVIPLENYISWFFLAAILQVIYHLLKLEGNVKIALHLYGSQLVFFSYFIWF